MADQNDLTQNVTLWNNTKSKNISTLTDGSVERLAVNALISDSEAPTKYQLKSDIDAVGNLLNVTTDTSLFSYTGAGILDFIAVSGSNANYEVVIKVDGTERIRVAMSELASLGLSNAANVDIWAETANKNFRYNPSEIGFETSFELLAKATGTPLPTVEHLTLFRERVTA